MEDIACGRGGDTFRSSRQFLTHLLNWFDMDKSNLTLAKIFEEMAELIQFKGEKDPADPFRIRAYLKTAQIIKNYPQELHKLWEEGKFPTKIPGIGEKSMEKIKEFFETGTIKAREKYKSGINTDALSLMSIPWVGPKLAKQLYEQLWINTPVKLKEMIEQDPQKLLSLPRMGEGKINQIRQGLKIFFSAQGRKLLGHIYSFAQRLQQDILSLPNVKKAEITGSFRRMKETVGDIDILVVSKEPLETIDKIAKFEYIEYVIAKWTTKISVFVWWANIQVDVRVVEKENRWAALQYFTWSKQHNIHLRKIAKTKNLKINEYWVFDETTSQKIGGENEEEVYKLLWLPWIPPELREDRGEIEAAREGRLPKLVKYWSLKWDFHVHSTWSDGNATIEQMVKWAIQKGYEFIWISDHSQSLAVAGWLKPDDLDRKIEEIQALRRKYPQIKILVGSEVEILKDWKLDYEDEVLKKLDVVIGAIHMNTKGDQTQRYLIAMNNPYLKIIAHPSWRLIGQRDEMQVDRDLVFKKAIDKGIWLEVNSQPARLDLKDVHIRKFLQMWGRIVINTDAHSVKELIEFDKFGIGTARRWWAQSDDVVNVHGWEVVKLLFSYWQNL